MFLRGHPEFVTAIYPMLSFDLGLSLAWYGRKALVGVASELGWGTYALSLGTESIEIAVKENHRIHGQEHYEGEIAGETDRYVRPLESLSEITRL